MMVFGRLIPWRIVAVIMAVAAVAVVVGGLWLSRDRLATQRDKSAVAASVGVASGKAGAAAVDAVADNLAGREAIRQEVEKGNADIRSAAGGDTDVSAVAAATRRSMCKQPGYIGTASCLRETGAGGTVGGDAGSRASGK